METILKDPVKIDIPKLFTKSKEIQIVLDDESARCVRQSRIIEVNCQTSLLLVTQPQTPIGSDWIRKKLVITSFLKQDENPRPNIGSDAIFIGFGKECHLMEKRMVQPILLRFEDNLFNADLNGWYNVFPGKRFTMEAVLNIGGSRFESQAIEGFFSVANLSHTEIGIMMPKMLKNGEPNPLLKLHFDIATEIDLELKDSIKRGEYNKRYRTEKEILSKLIHFEKNYDDANGYAAFRFLKMGNESREALSLFITDNQLNKIRLKEDLSPVHHKDNPEYRPIQHIVKNSKFDSISHDDNPEFYCNKT